MTVASNLYRMRQLALSDKISNSDFDIFMYFLHKKVENLRESDKNKIRNFEFEYNSKDDAEESLSEFLS